MLTSEEFLRLTREAHDRWQAAVDAVPRERMTEPGVEGDWSVKDVVAHIAWHEHEMLGVAKERALVGSDLWNGPTDERNAAIYERYRERPLEEVLADEREVYGRMLEEMGTLTDEELNTPARFRDMPSDWIPWQLIAGNTYEHYREHTPGIKAWLRSSG